MGLGLGTVNEVPGTKLEGSNSIIKVSNNFMQYFSKSKLMQKNLKMSKLSKLRMKTRSLIVP